MLNILYLYNFRRGYLVVIIHQFSMCFLRYRHKGWYSKKGQRFPGQISETGAVQPGPNHCYLEGSYPARQRVWSVGGIPDCALWTSDGSSWISRGHYCGDSGPWWRSVMTSLWVIWYTAPFRIIGIARPVPLFLLFTEDIWVYDQKLNTRQDFRISVFIWWHLHLDVLNSFDTTFRIRAQHF